jgi:hypothetical protein
LLPKQVDYQAILTSRNRYSVVIELTTSRNIRLTASLSDGEAKPPDMVLVVQVGIEPTVPKAAALQAAEHPLLIYTIGGTNAFDSPRSMLSSILWRPNPQMTSAWWGGRGVEPATFGCLVRRSNTELPPHIQWVMRIIYITVCPCFHAGRKFRQPNADFWRRQGRLIFWDRRQSKTVSPTPTTFPVLWHIHSQYRIAV